MRREVDRLIRDVGPLDEDLHEKLMAIASKVARRKKYLVIDVLEMESMVDKDKVRPVSLEERIEVEV